ATDNLPKSLIEVLGRPFAEWQLEWLKRQGVARVVFAIGHQGAKIRDALGDGRRFGIAIAYSDDGAQPMGTGGAVRLACDGGLMDQRFLVLYGDSYLTVDVGQVWQAAAERGTPMLTVFRNDGRWDKSNAAFADGRVTRFEKGLADPAAAGLHYIDYGLAVLDRATVVAEVPAGRPYDLADVYRKLAAAGALNGFVAAARFHEIGSPEGLARLARHLAATSK
ncbi:MAG TPA: sugar phosphate nucleotidyltransferase, partial [Afifellaceae bacterium]|nr:sugar phosphate nucleotidyltransferase [Afifellaceae bacterium]